MERKHPTFIGSVLKAVACTPNRNPDEKAYEAGVLEPCRRLRALGEKLGDGEPSEVEVRQALQWLALVLDTKMVETDEREQRLREIGEAHRVPPPAAAPVKADQAATARGA